MRILDFLRRNRESKNNIQTNPTDELLADVVNNETEEK